MAKLHVKPAPVEYAGRTVPLLSVMIDGQHIGHEFRPFDASATSISRYTCIECYVGTSGKITNCGGHFPEGLDTYDEIGIRRQNGKVVWFHQSDRGTSQYEANEDKHPIWFFDIDDYESQLGGDSSRLPEFNAIDIQRVVRMSRLPERQKSLYRIPLCGADPKGQRLMTLIHGLANDDGLTIADEPTDVIPYELGCERNCGPEVIFEVGIREHIYAFRLLRNPAFPFWLTSHLFNQRFPEIAGL
ncbi:MAG: hypothetical protein JNK57_08375 [Planctomycetaceae bacterium]|nr:hypothetical protein [Planctomycetaceae bacterium]